MGNLGQGALARLTLSMKPGYPGVRTAAMTGIGRASMGRMAMTDALGTRIHMLGAVNLVGRHWTCTARTRAAGVPLHWLEVRWQPYAPVSGALAGWAWRPLALPDETRGTGDVVGQGWRTLALGGRVRLEDAVTLTLEDDAAPRAHAVDLTSGEILVGDALDVIVERSPAGWHPLVHDGLAPEPLQDGDVVVHEGRAWRVIGDTHAATAQPHVHVRHPRLRCDVDVTANEATFSLDRRTFTVGCPAVRVLSAYVKARLDDSPEGGWRTAPEVWRAWVASGGPSQSAPERIGWEKGRLRSAIHREGWLDATGLFETRRRDDIVVSRIVLPPERLALHA